MFLNQIYWFEQDKTFGLKNKKGAKQQRFIQQVQHQVKSGGNVKKPEDLKKLDKEKKLKDQKEMNLLFKPVATQKVEKGKVLIRSTIISFLLFISFTVNCVLVEQISLS
jgi:hypothetical protein